MVQKKRRPKRSQKKKSSGSTFFKTELKKVIGGLCLLTILVALSGVLLHKFILNRQVEQPEAVTDKKVFYKVPPFEIYPKEEAPPPEPIVLPETPPVGKLPRVAIIIDDIGFDKNLAEKFLSLDAVLTFSVLPYSPFKKSFVRAAREKGAEIMLHLPMEPNEYPMIDPGPGTLLTAMTPDQLISQLEKNLDDVPLIKGVNNHMGSKMTSVSTQMYQIFSILKKRGLYFIDSRTTPDSLCKPSARLLQLSFAERNVFLDNVHDPEDIRGQIEHLVLVANSRGEAIGIAHPNDATYEVLRKMLPELRHKIDLVPASQIVHVAG